MFQRLDCIARRGSDAIQVARICECKIGSFLARSVLLHLFIQLSRVSHLLSIKLFLHTLPTAEQFVQSTSEINIDRIA
jgi:hypothetical protein